MDQSGSAFANMINRSLHKKVVSNVSKRTLQSMHQRLRNIDRETLFLVVLDNEKAFTSEIILVGSHSHY